MTTETFAADYIIYPRLFQPLNPLPPTWTEAWAATSGSIGLGYPTNDVSQVSNSPEADRTIHRPTLHFTTSSLNGHFINAVTLRLYGHSHGTAEGTIIVQNGQPTYPHYPPEASDYNKENYSGNGGSILISSLLNDDWNEIAFDTGALNWINQAGQTKLILRMQTDISGVPAPGGAEWFRFRSGRSSSSLRPQLFITYDTSDMIYTDHVIEINKLIDHTHPGMSIGDTMVTGNDVAHGNRVCLNVGWYHNHGASYPTNIYMSSFIGNWPEHIVDQHEA